MKMLVRIITIVFFVAALSLAAEYRVHAGYDYQELPSAVRLVLSEAGEFMDQGAYDQAVDALIAFRDRGGPKPAGEKPDSRGYHHPMIFFALGTCYLLQGQYEQAQASLSQAVTLDPSFVDAWLNLAKVYYERGDYGKAATCFANAYEKAEEKQPDHLYFSAVASLTAKQYDAAIAAFERLFQTHPGHIKPEWQENFVFALLSAGRHRQALPHIIKLVGITTGEKKVRWQETLLNQYLQLEMYAEARTYVGALTREAPTVARWWKALAHVSVSTADYEKALAALTICGYLTPLSGDEAKLWADLSLQVGIPRKAAPVYAAILRKRPDKRVLQNLVLAYRKLNKYEEALQAVAEYAPDNNDPSLTMLKADLLYTMKRYGDATDAYRRAAESGTPQAGKAWLMAGYAAWEMNDLGASRLAFKRAANFSQERKAALLAMRQLQNVNEK